MSKLGITYQEVAGAVERILSQGENPSNEKVRKKFGWAALRPLENI